MGERILLQVVHTVANQSNSITYTRQTNQYTASFLCMINLDLIQIKHKPCNIALQGEPLMEDKACMSVFGATQTSLCVFLGDCASIFLCVPVFN